MIVEEAVRSSRCQVAIRRCSSSGENYEYAGPMDDPHSDALLAGFKPPNKDAWYRNVSLYEATNREDWQPCLPKSAIEKLGDLAP